MINAKVMLISFDADTATFTVNDADQQTISIPADYKINPISAIQFIQEYVLNFLDAQRVLQSRPKLDLTPYVGTDVGTVNTSPK